VSCFGDVTEVLEQATGFICKVYILNIGTYAYNQNVEPPGHAFAPCGPHGGLQKSHSGT
jgi:hypothetical protein